MKTHDDEHLKMVSESEVLECYNRRDTIRIFSLKEITETDYKSRIIHESVDETVDKVEDLSDGGEAKVNPNCISIAHVWRI